MDVVHVADEFGRISRSRLDVESVVRGTPPASVSPVVVCLVDFETGEQLEVDFDQFVEMLRNAAA